MAATQGVILTGSHFQPTQSTGYFDMGQKDDTDVVEILRSTPLFADLDEDELDTLGGMVSWRLFKRNDIIFREGEAYRGFFLVVEGQVLVYKLSAEGRMLILHICRPGDIFADVPLFARSPYPAWAQAASPSKLLFFPKGEFESFLESHPGVCRIMLTILARRLLDLNARFEQVTLHEVSGRLARYLLEELQQQEHPDPVEPFLRLSVTKGMLAARLGTTLETLSRSFRKMSEEGVLQVRGNKIVIRDVRRLRELGR